MSGPCHWSTQDLQFLRSLIGGESQTVGRLSTPQVLTPAPIPGVHGQKSQISVLLSFSLIKGINILYQIICVLKSLGQLVAHGLTPKQGP